MWAGFERKKVQEMLLLDLAHVESLWSLDIELIFVAGSEVFKSS